MKYPIDVDQYITERRTKCGAKAQIESVLRDAIIPLVNDCYEDGLHGCSGYPLDINAEMEAFKQRRGSPMSPKVETSMQQIIEWCNEAYKHGRVDWGAANGPA